MPRSVIRVAIVLILIHLLGGIGAHAQSLDQANSGEPVLLTADEVIYDKDNRITTARGNVEISQGERVLRARKVIYDEPNDRVTAVGDVVLLEPSGDVLFADYVELTDQLKQGLVRDLKVLLKDDSRFAAAGGRRFGDETTVMKKAVYSPCKVCNEEGARPPLWQIRAVTVIHDKREQEIEYKDAFLEFYGVPVFYTPYFSHPDPTVKRKSGFLAPSYSSDENLGFTIDTPYFWAISDDKDATITPLFTTQAGVALALEYRQAFERGRFEIDGSGTYVDEFDNDGVKTGDKEFRGHVRSSGRYQIGNGWRSGFDVFRTTDDTYLRRYNISNENTLTSNAFVNYQKGREYLAVDTYAFQGLQVRDDAGTTPYVLPLVDYSYTTEPGKYGGRFHLNGDMLVLQRTGGADSNRVSGDVMWQLPHIAPAGDVYTLTAALRGDAYFLSDQTDIGSPSDTEFQARMVPLLAGEWRYPFVRSTGTVRQVVEPIAQVVWTPDSVGNNDVPNEDSQAAELDDTNLFSLNRFAGRDRIEDGLRVNYGVKLGAYGQSGGYTNLTFGQVYRLDEGTFGRGSGMQDSFSDYVAQFSIQPNNYLSFTDRVRLDKDDLSINRHEIYLQAGPPGYRVGVNYVALDSQESTILGKSDEQEIQVTATAKITDYWRLFGRYRYDIEGEQSINRSLGLQYLDECFDLSLVYEESFTRDRDLEPAKSFKLQIRLLPFN
ncbi:LPS-assembly protein LptD [Oceanibacterium hippocampi]|uniref:LPS-assembly protein LptD n=1 Tax=Oceanibacterium hippocampi TaxID=745714 RepID=A0A1Y5STY9_9PROT|nr:LPS assembly protein LptD [Oceanibacterium hippocampi]SLN48328.1 LPS-assembly protein LptD precursor [Oceanibacterium hippocampi]